MEAEEKLRIKQRLGEGCLLANIQRNPQNGVTVDQILDYLGVKLSAKPQHDNDGENHKLRDTFANVLDEAAAAARARDIRLLTLRMGVVTSWRSLSQIARPFDSHWSQPF